MKFDLVISGDRVVTDQGVGPATIGVLDGMIRRIDRGESALSGAPKLSAKTSYLVDDAVVMAALVDPHVHINEPGRTEWEGFASATRAAAAGGVTLIGDMPLNSVPPTTTHEALQIKMASGDRWVDCHLWGGYIADEPGDLYELLPHVRGIKCFLADSGVPEFPAVEPRELRSAMAMIAESDCRLLVHAELESTLARAARTAPVASRHYLDYLASRPRAAEQDAIELVLDLAADTGCAIHIVHLASADALPTLAKARADGIDVTVETCPHYLTFAAEEIPEGATEYKCAPPIREAENRERLWEGLREGVIDFIASDHSPCPPEAKRRDTGDFFAAWGGISTLGLGLSVVWTEARKRGFGLEDVARWMSSGPAQIISPRRKGRIEIGFEADLVVWDPDAEFVPTYDSVHFRHPTSPYLSRHQSLAGVVRRTFLRGAPIYPNFGEPGGRVRCDDCD